MPSAPTWTSSSRAGSACASPGSRPTRSHRSPSQTARRSSRRAARAVDPAFTPSESVRELCLRLDELPLALELAAARTALFSPEQLLDKLSQRLDLLKGARDADPRQQTLRATIEWSYDLLAPREQALFARLAVFSGGCTYEAAEEIAGADPDTLQSLLDKSLLRKRDSPLGPRYWMLETIREYARGKLEESAEAERLVRRHLAYYLALAEDVDEQRKVGEYELGRTRRGARQSPQRPRHRARARPRAGARSGREAWPLLEPARSLSRRAAEARGRSCGSSRCSSPSARVRALSEAGNLALWQADLDAAEQLGREALALAREHGDRSGSGYALNLLGMIATERDLDGAAVELYEQSLAEYEAAGDEAGRLVPLQNLAANAVARGDNQRAISLLRERIASTGGRDNYSLSLAIGLLGFALAANGESEEARQSFEESLEICRVHGFSRVEAEVLSGLADLMRTASPSKALEYYRESIELAWEMEYQALVAGCIRGIAAIALAGGDARDAATLLGVFVGLVEGISANTLSPGENQELDAAIVQAREALGNDAFDAAWAEGCSLSLDQAVDLSLTVTASPAVGPDMT